MSEFSILGFIAKLSDVAVHVHEVGHEALEVAAQIVKKEAKSELGTYQGSAGPFAGWQSLADATIAARINAGYPGDEPLLITGDLRDSIEHTVIMSGWNGAAWVGSDNPIAAYQEVGTKKIPPRSFLGGALFRKSEEVKNLIGGSIYGALMSEPDPVRHITGETVVIGQ